MILFFSRTVPSDYTFKRLKMMMVMMMMITVGFKCKRGTFWESINGRRMRKGKGTGWGGSEEN
jgi:hypothetical protein